VAKKKAATTDADVQAAEEQLAGILKQLDNFGVQLVEEQWRKMSEGENNAAIAWAAARRIGTRSPLPLCLIPFASAELRAEQNAYLAQQEEGRKVLANCVFCKPSFDKSEEGDETVKIKVKVPDSNMTGSTAREMLGKTRVRVEFSRRPMGEWNQSEIVDDGPRQIITCETEVPSFGWSDGNWQFAFLISAERFSLEDAIEIWKKQGSIRLQLLGAAVEDVPDVGRSNAPETAKKKPGRPKKEATAATGPTIPGTTPQELDESYNVALTGKYRLEISIVGQQDGRYSCKWQGDGPVGGCEQGEPSVRASQQEAVKASIGNAVDYWSTYSDDESKQVVAGLKHWLAELEAGKSAQLIEAESIQDDEEKSDEPAVAGNVG